MDSIPMPNDDAAHGPDAQEQPQPAAASQAQLAAAPQRGHFASFKDEVQAGLSRLRAVFAAMDNEEQPEFESLRGLPGVVLEPMSWEQLVRLVAEGSERALGTLGRHPAGIRRYWHHRDAVLLRQYASVADYLQLDIFGFQHELCPDGRKRAVVPEGFFWNGEGGDGQRGGDDSSSGNGSMPSGSGRGHPPGFMLVTKWRENDFPYHLEPGIRHWNLWANRPLSREEVEAHVAAKVPPCCDVTWFVNPPSVQSVPSIWHAHVLYRERQGAQQQPAAAG